MNKPVIVICIILLLIFLTLSCHSSKKMAKNIKLTENKMIDPSITNASELIRKSDCATCHMIDKKLIGPAWIDVSKKYTLSDSVIKYLSNKILNGGSGVWGGVPMTPHYNTLSRVQSNRIAEYILNLKNN